MIKNSVINPVAEDQRERSGLFLLAAASLAVGTVAGITGSAFHWILNHATTLRDGVITFAHTTPWIGWLVPAGLAAAAAFIARWLVRRYAPEASGSGVQHIEAVLQGESRPMRAAVLPVKFVGGVLAIGSGLALGREGPTVQMGATLGHWLAHRFRLQESDVKVLIAAGAGAGLAAAFNTPLAGAIFVFEELLRRFSVRVAVATLSACGAALAVMHGLIGNRLVFSVPAIEIDPFPGYLLFFVFGALVGLLGIAYTQSIIAMLNAADRMHRVPVELRAAAVGGIVGLFAYFEPATVGGGESLVQDALNGGYPVETIVLVLAARFALGPLSYAPGLPGGLFAPMLVIGAVAGALFGFAVEALLPAINIPMAAYVAVGMGALFVAVVGAPLTGIALVVEMTGATALFVPLFTACATALAVTAALGVRPIYDTLRDRDTAGARR
jgi:chloride channel protein, CIC family